MQEPVPYNPNSYGYEIAQRRREQQILGEALDNNIMNSNRDQSSESKYVFRSPSQPANNRNIPILKNKNIKNNIGFNTNGQNIMQYNNYNNYPNQDYYHQNKPQSATIPTSKQNLQRVSSCGNMVGQYSGLYENFKDGYHNNYTSETHYGDNKPKPRPQPQRNLVVQNAGYQAMSPIKMQFIKEKKVKPLPVIEKKSVPIWIQRAIDMDIKPAYESSRNNEEGDVIEEYYDANCSGGNNVLSANDKHHKFMQGGIREKNLGNCVGFSTEWTKDGNRKRYLFKSYDTVDGNGNINYAPNVNNSVSYNNDNNDGLRDYYKNYNDYDLNGNNDYLTTYNSFHNEESFYGKGYKNRANLNMSQNGNRSPYYNNRHFNINNSEQNRPVKINNDIQGERDEYYKNYHKENEGYPNSRYGDKTYNYYLNSPMQGSRTEQWKYPPQYRYNAS